MTRAFRVIERHSRQRKTALAKEAEQKRPSAIESAAGETEGVVKRSVMDQAEAVIRSFSC